jgi:hypothetical protein
VKTIVTKDEKALVRLFKRAKTRLSTCSKSSAINRDIASQNTTNNDEASTVLNDSSNIEIVEVDPEKELGTFVEYFQWPLTNSWPLAHITDALKKSWCSPIYSFFKSDSVSIQYHNGRMCHFFPCAAQKCKTAAGGVQRFQDSKDKSSTANLKHHAIQCFGEEAVKNITNGKAGAA